MSEKSIDRKHPLSDWMSVVSDGQPLTKMTILGTHDSTAFHEYLWYGRCQTGSLIEHLNRGARYFDMRCYVRLDYFLMHHGFIDEKVGFGQVFGECIDFLFAHPTETIFMRIKQEESNASNAQFMKIFNEKYGGCHKYMHFSKNGIIDKLGDVRGKVVIIANVATMPGIQWNDIEKQDNDSIHDDKEKWNLIRNHLDLAANGNIKFSTNKYYLNGFNGHGALDGTEKIHGMAKYMRVQFLDYIRNHKNCSFYGLLALDFFDIYTDDDIKSILYPNNW